MLWWELTVLARSPSWIFGKEISREGRERAGRGKKQRGKGREGKGKEIRKGRNAPNISPARRR